MTNVAIPEVCPHDSIRISKREDAWGVRCLQCGEDFGIIPGTTLAMNYYQAYAILRANQG